MAMTFLELWGEEVDPGQIGSVGVGQEHEACRSPTLVWLRLMAVVSILLLLWYLSIREIPWPLWQASAAVIGGTLIYVAVAYLFRPDPDMGNLGWCGGLMDNPVRWSDDANRFLLALAIFLGPGRFVAESIFDAVTMLSPTDVEDGERIERETISR
jgi:hypothetical protein